MNAEYPDYDLVERIEEEDRPHFPFKIVGFLVLLVAMFVGMRRYEKWVSPPVIATAPGIPECWQEFPCVPYTGGLISGTPSTIGTVTWTITTTSPLPDGVQGVPYTYQIQSAGSKPK